MEKTDRLSNYLAISKIQEKVYYRNLWIAGGLLFFSLISTTATLLLFEWNERSIWLMGIFDVLFVINFLMAWTRLEITKKNMDLVNIFLMQDR